MEIAKISYEDQEKIASVSVKEAEVREIDNRIETAKSDVKNNRFKTDVEKVQCCLDLLEGITVDAENTVFNSEPKIVPIFTVDETKVIKDKVFEILKRF